MISAINPKITKETVDGSGMDAKPVAARRTSKSTSVPAGNVDGMSTTFSKSRLWHVASVPDRPSTPNPGATLKQLAQSPDAENSGPDVKVWFIAADPSKIGNERLN